LREYEVERKRTTPESIAIKTTTEAQQYISYSLLQIIISEPRGKKNNNYKTTFHCYYYSIGSILHKPAIQRKYPKEDTMKSSFLRIYTSVLIAVVAISTTNNLVAHGWVSSNILRKTSTRSSKTTTIGTKTTTKPTETATATNTKTSLCSSASNNNNDESSSNEQQQPPTAVYQQSEAERQELVNALFKGKSLEPPQTTNNNNANNLGEQIDEFLDKPFFDPDAYDDDDTSLLGKFASFAKADYELFEAFFVACFFLILITITKDLLRAEMTARGLVSAGKLF